jgi:alginate O-acetyltransferase complex protein AlgI
MVFCSIEFFLFFLFVAAAYWTLPSRPARALASVVSAAYLGYVGWYCLSIAYKADGWHIDAFDAAWASLPFNGELFFVAAVVCFGAGMAWAFGPHRGRVWLLLAASFYFYASVTLWLALLIFASTILDYCLAHGIQALKAPAWRKTLVAVSVTANLGLLCYFKYTNFFLSSLEHALHRCGSSASFPLLSILAPLGISFYTFEAINYIVDVYRGRVRAEGNLANFMLFILFFPHLIAGPIVRARDFLPQIRRRKRWDWMRTQLGLRFFLMGLFKKWVIADRMALYADPVFAHPGSYNCIAIWMAVIAYALEIYGDFSGYTDMAIGTAHMLGFHLAKNFDMPYLSANVSEFWRRWHISLSTWLRDYLFIPLGGSRGGKWQTCRNLLITMTLGGLWHGASWTFIIWGLLHGLLLIGHRMFQGFCKGRPLWTSAMRSRPGTAGRVLITFLCVSLCWVFFRAQSFGDALRMLSGLLRLHGQNQSMSRMGLGLTILVVMACHLLARWNLWQRAAARLPAPVLGATYALLLTLCLVLAPPASKPFIYFQF